MTDSKRSVQVRWGQKLIVDSFLRQNEIIMLSFELPMFTCSVGDEVFGHTSEPDNDKVDTEERRKLMARCRKLERELKKRVSANDHSEEKHMQELEEIRECHERKIHELNAKHAIDLSTQQAESCSEIEACCERITHLERELKYHMTSEVLMWNKILQLKSLLTHRAVFNGERHMDYMHIEHMHTHFEGTSSTDTDTDTTEGEQQILVLSKEGGLDSIPLTLPLPVHRIETLCAEVVRLLHAEISNREECEHQFDLLVNDYNDVQKEKMQLHDQVRACCR